MTEEIIKSITDVETQAAEMKKAAQEKAALILAQAQEKASEMENAALESAKSYRETRLKESLEDAEKEYAATLAKNTSAAKAYCETALNNSENSVMNIVGRIVRGDC